jgi:hypothetical protein
MANIYVENRDRWLELSSVDYLGAFANAWLAFNAWYRSVYNENTDRKILNEFKWQPNDIRNKLIPVLSNPSTEDAVQLRNGIGLLHHRLENYHLHSGKGDAKERISLTNVYLRDNSAPVAPLSKSGISYEVIRGGPGVPSGQIASLVKKQNGSIAFQLVQARYDLPGLESNVDYLTQLSSNQQAFLRGLYLNANPREICNLLEGSQPAITCGAYDFNCRPENLFAGVVETIYLMRCSYFHGELVPSREASACYEPAYHIIRRFLQAIS